MKRRIESIDVFYFSDSATATQGSLRRIGLFRLMVTRRRMLYPSQQACETPVMEPRMIATTKIGKRIFAIRPKDTLDKKGHFAYRQFPHISLSGAEMKAIRILRALQRGRRP